MINKKQLLNHKLSGMTLIELLLVLALIGILLSMAVPKLLPLIGRTKSLEAQMQLKHIHTLQKNFYYINSRYTSDLDELGYEQTKMVTENGKANYRIEITQATNAGFIAKALSVTDFDQDGQFNEWLINENEELKESTKD